MTLIGLLHEHFYLVKYSRGFLSSREVPNQAVLLGHLVARDRNQIIAQRFRQVEGF